MSWIYRPLRLAQTAAHKLLKATWFVRRPRTYGAHALALTPLLIVEDVCHEPSWSWEVEQVTDFPIDSLPDDMAPGSRDWMAAVEGGI